MRIKNFYVIVFIISVFVNCAHLYSQELKWLRVSELQSFINDIGAEYEGENTQGNTDLFSWPAQYGHVFAIGDQTNTRAKALWIGSKNFSDPVENRLKSVKVVGSGPRDGSDRVNQIFQKELKLIGKFAHPTVIVDDQNGTALEDYDHLDDIDPNLGADRMVLVKFNTSMGVTVTKKVYVTANSEHGNYFINDYVFKNTGIYNRNGDVKQQTLDSVWFYFCYRYAHVGVASSAFGSTWGAFESQWGENTLNHAFGTDPNAPGFEMRAFYSYYGPSNRNVRPGIYEEDWGCPNLNESGVLASAKYSGCVTIHADKSATDKSNDLTQPRTTAFISSDISIMSANVSQYDESFMSDRYTAMTEGHMLKPHDEEVGTRYPYLYVDPRRQSGGGTSQGQGYGPYTLAPGDSVHIVFAEGVSGISWEKGREVGANWLQWRNTGSGPTLKMPDGSTTTDYNLYKRRWCETGIDSIKRSFRNAIQNYNSNFSLPDAPPPSKFTVTSGGDRIRLSWEKPSNFPNQQGYVIYRAEGSVNDYRTIYTKIFETDNSDVTLFDDVTARRGFDYYYYIQSKDNGATGRIIYSSMFWTLTSVAATLQRPAGSLMDEIRIVPNPFNIKGRAIQYGDKFQYDRIAFYGLPPICKLRIFTERGDLIWEKDHSIGTGDELWNSLTSSGQIVASGIYILHIEVTEDTYASEDKVARYNIYDDDLKLKANKGDVIKHKGELMFRKGESKLLKFIVIR
jgi:hypothetical protein